MAGSNVLTLHDCVQVARRHFDNENAQVSHWKERRLGEGKPAGFLGDHKLAEVYASVNGREECIRIFIKTLPHNDTQVDLIKSSGAFQKEVLFYSTLVGDWEKRGIISKKSVAERLSGEEKEGVDWNLRCYIARDDMVVLENIASSGYKSDNPRDVYDYDHVLVALKMLASFHAASLIYEEERSAEMKKRYRIVEEYPELLIDTFYTIKDGHHGEKTTEAGIVGLVEGAKLLSIYESASSVRRRVEQDLPQVLRKIYNSVKASTRFRNVLCHADLWQNNLLFRHHTNGRPENVIPVDFQLLRYAPPAHDVYNLLYLTTRRSLRQAHEIELLDEYYTALSAAIKRRGLDVENVLPRAEFDASLEEQRFAGRLHACFVLHFVMLSEEVLGPVFKDPEAYASAVWEGQGRARLVCTQFKEDAEYRERIEECLMELLEKDVLV